MEELKTLKDMKTERVFPRADVTKSEDESSVDVLYVAVTDLRAEAIKWYKSIDGLRYKCMNNDDSKPEGCDCEIENFLLYEEITGAQKILTRLFNLKMGI